MTGKSAAELARENALVEGASKLYPVLELECEGKRAVCVGGHDDDIDSINVVVNGKILLISEWVLEHCLRLPGGTTKSEAEDRRLTLTKPYVIAYGNQHVHKTPLLQWCRDMCTRHGTQDLSPGTQLLVFWWDMEHSKQDKQDMCGNTWWPASYVPKYAKYGVWYSARVLRYDPKWATLHVVYDYNEPDELEHGKVILPLNYVHFGNTPPPLGGQAQVFPPPWKPPMFTTRPQQDRVTSSQDEAVQKKLRSAEKPPSNLQGSAQKCEGNVQQQPSQQEPSVSKLPPQHQEPQQQHELPCHLEVSAGGSGPLIPSQQPQKPGGLLVPSKQRKVQPKLPAAAGLQAAQTGQASAVQSVEVEPRLCTGSAGGPTVPSSCKPAANIDTSKKSGTCSGAGTAGAAGNGVKAAGLAAGTKRNTRMLDDLEGDNTRADETSGQSAKRPKLTSNQHSNPTSAPEQQPPVGQRKPAAITGVNGNSGLGGGRPQQLHSNRGLPPRPPISSQPAVIGVISSGGTSAGAGPSTAAKQKQVGVDTYKQQQQPSKSVLTSGGTDSGGDMGQMAGAVSGKPAAARHQQPPAAGALLAATVTAVATAAPGPSTGGRTKAIKAASGAALAPGVQTAMASGSQLPTSSGSRQTAPAGSQQQQQQRQSHSTMARDEQPQLEQPFPAPPPLQPQPQQQKKRKQQPPNQQKQEARSTTPQHAEGGGRGAAKGPAGQPSKSRGGPSMMAVSRDTAAGGSGSSSAGLSMAPRPAAGAGAGAAGVAGPAPRPEVDITVGPTSRVRWPGTKRQDAAVGEAVGLMSRPAAMQRIALLSEAHVRGFTAAKGLEGSSAVSEIIRLQIPLLPGVSNDGQHLQHPVPHPNQQPHAESRSGGAAVQPPSLQPSEQQRRTAARGGGTGGAGAAAGFPQAPAIMAAAPATVTGVATTITPTMNVDTVSADGGFNSSGEVQVTVTATTTTAAGPSASLAAESGKATTVVQAAVAMAAVAAPSAAPAATESLRPTVVQAPAAAAAAAASAAMTAATVVASARQAPVPAAAPATATGAGSAAQAATPATTAPAAGYVYSTTEAPTLAGCCASLCDALTQFGSVAIAGSATLLPPPLTPQPPRQQQQPAAGAGGCSNNAGAAVTAASVGGSRADRQGFGSDTVAGISVSSEAAGASGGGIAAAAIGGRSGAAGGSEAARLLPPVVATQQALNRLPSPSSPPSSDLDSDSDDGLPFVDNRHYVVSLPSQERQAAYEALIPQRRGGATSAWPPGATAAAPPPPPPPRPT